MPPSLRNCIAWRTAGRLRFIVPTCTILPYFFCASTSCGLPRSCATGFSTYTCLPACSAMMVMSACQWFGVAMMTASMSLSSRTRRKSCTNSGLNVGTSASALSLTRSASRLRVDVGDRLDLDVLQLGKAALEGVALAADADAGESRPCHWRPGCAWRPAPSTEGSGRQRPPPRRSRRAGTQTRAATTLCLSVDLPLWPPYGARHERRRPNIACLNPEVYHLTGREE